MTLYRPANALEAIQFSDRLCCRCKNDENDECPILSLSVFMQTTDPDYPQELTYDASGDPTCTAFDPVDKEPWQKALDEISGVRA